MMKCFKFSLYYFKVKVSEGTHPYDAEGW